MVNATGPLVIDSAINGCGTEGCCIAPVHCKELAGRGSSSACSDQEPSVELQVFACDGSAAQVVTTTTVGGGEGAGFQLSFVGLPGHCIGAGTAGVELMLCSPSTAWTAQQGDHGNLTVIHHGGGAGGCLTVGAKHGATAAPGMSLEIDQCWHINATQNLLVPGVAYAPAPPPGPPPRPHPAASTTAWGVQDLTVYISHWYNGVFQASTGGLQHEFFSVRRVRVRANPWTYANPDPTSVTRGRGQDYVLSEGQIPSHNMVTANTANFAVTDNDFYGALGAIIYSSGGGPACFGHIARNRMYNGMTSHWFDNARDIIFEDNQMTGVSLTAYGSNVDTYGGGYAQHVLFFNNTYDHVWGNDREITTYDNAGGCYFGPVKAYAAGSLSLTATGTARAAECSGGAIIVLNGSGIGQVRRVVAQTTAGGETVWAMDEPFAAAVDEGASWVQVMPFRGRNLFVANTYRDVGAVQFYGIGLEQIVANNVGERMGGFLSWGQWRGYDHNGVRISPPSSGGGGAGFNPNRYNQFLGNEIREGNTIVNYNGEYNDASGGFGCFLNGSSMVVTDATHWAPDGTGEHFHGEAVPKLGFPLNAHIVFRGNIFRSNSGIRVEGQAEDVLIEGTVNQATDTPHPVVTGDCARVLVSCPNGTCASHT